ncbi:MULTISPECIES: type II toxin-antitoxin system VapC family toxin [Methylosinus]|uniref:PIN domain-containing protein n=1 Tax=Methylosinus trichosporium (strain ATCC 35070 / NCIMB 11131 / UNIQEM 75 / OB3b) TaxID=595536 RepID=A0A2D2D384_METT3|nr:MULTISPECIES: type II toxin-antitoxin system VapC family toxin [Methylosinus]ATQ69463.1 PIN domain-containing protein [Methylosinus trichosporium OB3b]OBS52973.1 twitching motility protein PilT [Methylosinus sp. 3S-1]
MRLLLDTHVLLHLMRDTLHLRDPRLSARLASPSTQSHASVASLWEVAIKTRLGKLDPGMALDDIADYMEAIGLSILPIDRRHAVVGVEPDPATRDPFDRMLLAQCSIENLRLATLDRALLAHPLSLPRD